MPFLIDANNLMHALASAGVLVGREGLAKLLAPLALKDRVHVVFDGARPPLHVAQQIDAAGVQSTFCPAGPADAMIIKAIALDSAPRRLTVVSTDHEIRAAAHHRRCIVITSEDFAAALVHSGTPAAAEEDEPQEKTKGLTQAQTRAWLKEFGLDDDEE
ncbi:MAG: NYN domain-containing protein [Planctomycetaceae bacterium]|nr:NYN domain-containing protein [Planctomycetaceae bacterium]